MSRLAPLKLGPSFREKIWGSRDLSPIFGERDEPVGEAWYTHEENTVTEGPHQGRTIASLIREYGPRLMGTGCRPEVLQRTSTDVVSDAQSAQRSEYFPILTKLLFPSEKLSAQVHPHDSYALQHDGGPGKTEMWYVVAAQPDAAIALGLTEDLATDGLARVAKTGEIERYLRWVPVSKGQTVLVSPGTVHTLGPGVVVCEIQQNSDLTYRFYDFGRTGDDGKPRPLHIEKAVEVTDVTSRPSPELATDSTGGGVRVASLAGCDYFVAERLTWMAGFEYQLGPERCHVLVVIDGTGSIGPAQYGAGDAFLVPAEADPFEVTGSGCAIRAFVP